MLTEVVGKWFPTRPATSIRSRKYILRRAIFQEAVKTQTKALELQPRSLALKRHLDVFREKLRGGKK